MKRDLVRIWPDCIPCILKMFLKVVRTFEGDESKIRRFMAEILKPGYWAGHHWTVTSPEIIRDIWLMMQKTFGVEDPLKRTCALARPAPWPPCALRPAPWGRTKLIN